MMTDVTGVNISIITILARVEYHAVLMEFQGALIRIVRATSNVGGGSKEAAVLRRVDRYGGGTEANPSSG
jgi:hypothetical protein